MSGEGLLPSAPETGRAMSGHRDQLQVRARVRLVGQAARDFAEHAARDLWIFSVEASHGGDLFQLSQANPPERSALLRGLFDRDDVAAAAEPGGR